MNFSLDWLGLKTLGIAMSAREIESELVSLDDICISYYISFKELMAEVSMNPVVNIGASRIRFNGNLSVR